MPDVKLMTSLDGQIDFRQSKGGSDPQTDMFLRFFRNILKLTP